GLRDHSFSPLFGGPFVAMLFFVVHRLGGSRKSAREVAASRLFCFYRRIFGVPKWDRLRAGRRRSLPVHNPTVNVAKVNALREDFVAVYCREELRNIRNGRRADAAKLRTLARSLHAFVQL